MTNDWLEDYFFGFIAGAGLASVAIMVILVVTGAV